MRHIGPSSGTQDAPSVDVVVEGDFDLTTVPEVRAALDNAIALRPARLFVDLSRCTFLDAAAIGALVGANRRVRADGGRLILRSPSRPARRIMRLVDMASVLPVTSATRSRRGRVTRRRTGAG